MKWYEFRTGFWLALICVAWVAFALFEMWGPAMVSAYFFGREGSEYRASKKAERLWTLIDRLLDRGHKSTETPNAD